MKHPNDPFGDQLYGVQVKGSLWLLLPKLAIGIVASTAFIFAMFWLQFGEINTFPVLISAIAAIFQVLLVIGLRHQGSFRKIPLRKHNRVLDTIGAFWLIAVIFGSIVAWFTADLAGNFPTYAVPLHAATLIFSIVLPVVTSIPNYRYVTLTNAHVTIPMLFIVSMLPSLVAWRSVAILWTAFTN